MRIPSVHAVGAELSPASIRVTEVSVGATEESPTGRRLLLEGQAASKKTVRIATPKDTKALMPSL